MIIKAALFIQDAVDGVKRIQPRDGQQARRAFVWHLTLMPTVQMVAWLSCVLTFVERPLWCNQRAMRTSVHRPCENEMYPSYPVVYLSWWWNLCLETLCLLPLAGHSCLLLFVQGGRFWSNARQCGRMALAVFSVADMAIGYSTPESFFRLAPYLRLGFVVLYSNQVRTRLLLVAKTMPEVMGIFGMIVSFIAFFAWIGVLIFDKDSPEGRQYFADLGDGMWSLYILLTTANFPDVMMPIYRENRFAILFFFVFIVLGVFFLSNVMTAVVFNVYNEQNEESKQQKAELRKECLEEAFQLLSAERLEVDAGEYEGVHGCYNRCVGDNGCATYRHSESETTIYFRDGVWRLHKIGDDHQSWMYSCAGSGDSVPGGLWLLNEQLAGGIWGTLHTPGDIRVVYSQEVAKDTMDDVFKELNRYKDIAYVTGKDAVKKFDSLDKSHSGTLTREEFGELAKELLTRVRSTPKPPFLEWHFKSLTSNSAWLGLKGVVHHEHFDHAVDFVLLLNFAVMVAETWGAIVGDPDSSIEAQSERWRRVELGIASVYFLEACLKILTDGFERYWSQFKNQFDFLVTLATTATMILVFYPNSFSDPKIIRYVAMLRLLRVTRLLLRVRETRVVMRTFVRMLPQASAVAKVLLCFVYCFGVLGTQLFGGVINKDPNSKYFERVNNTAFAEADYYANNFNDMPSAVATLFELLVVNNWFVLAEGFGAACGTWAYAYFVVFHVLCVVICFNIVLSFILDTFVSGYERKGAEGKEGALSDEKDDQFDEEQYTTEG